MKVWKRLLVILLVLLVGIVAAFFFWLQPRKLEYGYARPVSPGEAEKRDLFVSTATGWLGCKESDGTHKPIIDIYNNHPPLAVGYTVKYTDKWCATFVSAVAIQCGYTDFIPTECGCQRQIELFVSLGRWEEDDAYIPLPGDLIYYCQNYTADDDCTEHSDHVGIVVGTNGDQIKVIEGNFNGEVRYRYIKADHPTIRGYALPDYSQA